MRVALRADASPQIGMGHVTRCLALAQALSKVGVQSCLVSRALGVDTEALARQVGVAHRALEVPHCGRDFESDPVPHAAWAGVAWQHDATQTAAALLEWAPAWVVVDHYAFDARWHRAVQRALSSRIAVIDDLADRELEAAILIDQNLSQDVRAKYAGRWPSDRPLLGGPRYALLGPQYASARRYHWREQVGSIGIFMGGTDAAGLSERVLEACRTIAAFRDPVEVVTTNANPRLDTLRRACARWESTTLAVDLPELSSFFARHDLQIGAGGSATWERCCIGAPTLGLVAASNQAAVIAAIARQGVVRSVAEATLDAIGQAVIQLINDASGRRSLAERSRALVDGHGAERVAVALMADSITLRPASNADAEVTYHWRNDPRTRRYSRDPSAFTRDSHASWWQSTLEDPQRRLLIASCGRRAIGTLRLDLSGASAEVSLYLDPELTGLGLGTGLLVTGQRWIATHEPTVKRLVAYVDANNRASAGAFARAGFARVHDLEWIWEMRPD